MVGSVVLGILALVLTSVALGGVDATGPDDGILDGGAAPARVAIVPAAATTVAPEPAPAWVESTSATTGVPAVAVRAYARAALVLGQESPGCRLGWTTLAGIGSVESDHGRLGGAVLQADGTSLPPIVGPALDGTAGFAAIPSDPEGASRHGDARWDRAVGPMQFISDTWSRWADDGDGDGRADPLDIDDATLAAGRYLCHAGADLTTADGWSAAVFSYNHSQDYVRLVLSRANAIASAVG